MKIHSYRWQPFGTTFQELSSFLKNLGYKIFEVTDHRNQKERKDVLKEVYIDSEFTENSMLYVVKE